MSWPLWKTTNQEGFAVDVGVNDFQWSIEGLLLLLVVMSVMLILAAIAQWQRIRTKRKLEACGLPTVYWTPRFWRNTMDIDNNSSSDKNKNHDMVRPKLASTTITRILPRMKRLQGPYGMYGTVYGLTTPVVHVAHPVPARAILTGSVGSIGGSCGDGNVSQRSSSSSTSSFISSTSVAASTGASKAPAYNHFKNFCGDGVFTADGDDWKAKRAAVLHCLIKGVASTSSDAAVKLERETNHAADVFCQQVQSLQNRQKIQEQVNTNVVPLLQRATVGLIYRYLVHQDPDWAILPFPSCNDAKSDDKEDGHQGLVSTDSETASLSSWEEIDEGTMASSSSSPCNGKAQLLLDSYLNAIVRIRMIILAQSRSIWFLLPRWCYQWFSSLHQDEEETLKPIRQFARQACENARPGSPLFRLANDKDGPYHFGDRPDSISQNLLDEAITLLFAGQDTSAATLSWTLHLLSLHPDIQQRLADEVRGVVAPEQSSSSGRQPVTVTRAMITRMPYLDAVIKESMRLYPVAPFVVRRLQQDVVVPNEVGDHDESKASSTNAVLPEGSVACLWIYALHRNPDLWNCPDAFLPDRWMDPSLKDPGQLKGAYMPFAAGPRNCLGQPLAHVILRTLLARLVNRFQFIDKRVGQQQTDETSYVRSLRKDMQAGFTILPTGGVDLCIQER